MKILLAELQDTDNKEKYLNEDLGLPSKESSANDTVDAEGYVNNDMGPPVKVSIKCETMTWIFYTVTT